MNALMNGSAKDAALFVECLDQVGNGKGVGKLLGLAGVEKTGVACKRDLRKVVYHAHPSQLYTVASVLQFHERHVVQREVPEEIKMPSVCGASML